MQFLSSKVLLFLNDVYLDILFVPIPLFPAIAGYCVGLLCKAKVSIRIQLVRKLWFAILIIFLTNIGVAIVVCVMYRHQTILMDSDRFKMKKRTKHLVRNVLFVLFNITPIALIIPRDDVEKIDQMINSYPHNISWIRDRGDTYIIIERTPMIIVLILIILLVLFVATCALSMMFGHMFYVLRKSICTDRSFERSQRVRKSLFVLLIQLIVPILLLVVPASTLLFGLLTVDWISFGTSLFMYCILPFHSIGHNIILLAITPIYRNFIAYFINIYTEKKDSKFIPETITMI
ncbi:hypothetical protein PMAYCL1PPCAC_17339, partial [Pristionchus mayeri]